MENIVDNLRRTRALILMLLLIGVGVGLRVVMGVGTTPFLATVPLSLDFQADVHLALDSERSRLFIINAGIVQTFDTRSGVRLAWTRLDGSDAGLLYGPEPLVDERAGAVFVPNGLDPTAGVIDAQTGRVLRLLYIGHQPNTLVLDDRRQRLLVASTADWTLTTFDVRARRVVRTIRLEVGGAPGQLAIDPGSDHAFIAGYSGEIAMVSLQTGRLLRMVVPDHWHIVTDMAVDAYKQRVLGLVEDRPDVVMLDTRTGRVIGMIVVGQNPDGIAVDAGTGRTFIADAGTGAIQVLDTARGLRVRTVPVGPAPILAVDTVQRHVIVAVHHGLDVLDARDGTLLRHLSLNIDATMMVVDGRTSHILVVSASEMQPMLTSWSSLGYQLHRWFPLLPAPSVRWKLLPPMLYVLDERRL